MCNAACIDETMDSVHIGMCIFSESIDISDDDDDDDDSALQRIKSRSADPRPNE